MWRRWILILLAAMAAPPVVGRPVAAQEADEPEQAAAQAPPVPLRSVRISDRRFDRWLFGNGLDAATARRLCERRLRSRIGYVDQICGLGGAQRKKLELAGRGDVKRLFERVERVREEYRLAEAGQQAIDRLTPDVQELAARYVALFEDESLFSKTLRTTLDRAQAERYREHWSEHRLRRHQSRVEWVARTLQRSLALGDDQQVRLLCVLLEETRPARSSGPSDYYGILYQVSRIPEGRLRPIFDEPQWRLLRLEFDAARRQEPMLREYGLLPEDRPRWDTVRGRPSGRGGDQAGPAPGALGKTDAGDGSSSPREERRS